MHLRIFYALCAQCIYMYIQCTVHVCFEFFSFFLLVCYCDLNQVTLSQGIQHVPLHGSILCVHPILQSHMRQVGLSQGIPCVPLHGSILCVHPILYSHMRQVGLSYRIPCVPLHGSILCVHPILYSHMRQVGLSYRIPCVPLHSSILCVHPILYSHMRQVGLSYRIPCVPLHSSILCVHPILYSHIPWDSPTVRPVPPGTVGNAGLSGTHGILWDRLTCLIWDCRMKWTNGIVPPVTTQW